MGQSGGFSLAREVARFTGRAEAALDDKGRLVVPARFRERLGSTFVVTIASADPCLALYPEAAWEAFCKRLEDAPLKNDAYRNFVRHLFAHTDETSCDAQGRISVPPALRAYAGIERDVVTVGALSRVELWSKERLAAVTPSADEAAALTTELGLY